MANYSFGDVDQIVCQHPTGEFRFKPKSNESGTFDKGGVRANDDANQVTSDGTMMRQLNRILGSFEVPCAVQNNLSDIDNAGKLASSPELGNWTVSFLNGAIIKGKGAPVGDLQYDSNAGTFTLKIAVEREWELLNV